MRILLANPNYTIKKESRDDFSFFPPLGLGYLAALLEKNGHEVIIQDYNLSFVGEQVKENFLDPQTIRYGATDEEIRESIRAFKPDLVGISSIFTPFYRDAARIAALVKELNPKILTVLGGAHSSMEYEKVIQDPCVDMVIRGEAEIPFTELVNRLSRGESRDFPGVVWKRDDGSVSDNGMGEQVKNLDDLPLPAYHMLNMPFYTSRKDKNFAYSMRFPIGHMITSRGCPYTCVFCSTRNFFPNYRVNSPQRVIEEIEFLIKTYGVREIHFHDDAFLIQRKRVVEICRLLKEKKLNITWQISQGVNLNLVDEELLKIMHESGMYRMGLPIESGSENTLTLIRKRVKLDHAKNIIAAANKLGIFTHANFIIGFPFETREEVQKTYDFASSCGVDVLKMLICQPLAGSELYNVYKKEGLLDEIRHSSTYTSTDYNTSHFTADQLNQIRRKILIAFYWNQICRILFPRSFFKTIFPKLRTRETFFYVMRLTWMQFRGALRSIS